MTSKNTSLNSYSHHAPKMDWVRQYFEYKNTFDENHTLGSQMYSFSSVSCEMPDCLMTKVLLLLPN